MVRMDICGLLWLSGWWSWVRDATCTAWERNLLDEPRRVNPLAASTGMRCDLVVVPHDAAAPLLRLELALALLGRRRQAKVEAARVRQQGAQGREVGRVLLHFIGEVQGDPEHQQHKQDGASGDQAPTARGAGSAGSRCLAISHGGWWAQVGGGATPSSQIMGSVQPSAAKSAARKSASPAQKNSSRCGGFAVVPASMACA
jgi:hypothetical protein